MLLRRMLTGREAAARPNHHTLNTVLQHQVAGERWGEALKTLDLLLLFQRPASAATTAAHGGGADVESTPLLDQQGVHADGSCSTNLVLTESPEFAEVYILARKMYQRQRRALATSHGTGPGPVFPSSRGAIYCIHLATRCCRCLFLSVVVVLRAHVVRTPCVSQGGIRRRSPAPSPPCPRRWASTPPSCKKCPAKTRPTANRCVCALPRPSFFVRRTHYRPGGIAM